MLRFGLSLAVLVSIAATLSGCVVFPEVPHSVLVNSEGEAMDADILGVATTGAGLTTAMSRSVVPAGRNVTDAEEASVRRINLGLIDWTIYSMSPSYLSVAEREAHLASVNRLAAMMAADLPEAIAHLEGHQKDLLPYRLRLDIYPFDARFNLRYQSQTREVVDLRFAARAPSMDLETAVDDRTWVIETVSSLFHEYYHVLVSHSESLHFPNQVSEEAAAHLFDACTRITFLAPDQVMSIGFPPELGNLSEEMSTFDFRVLRRNLRADTMIARWIAYTTIAHNVGTTSIAGDSEHFSRLQHLCRTADPSGIDFTTGQIPNFLN